ncbi:hypothetical protein M404DRAFT_23471 [Pisolithus tinctorius Marx 270]|uniref:Squalene monooxygenase n=1 Tax=Pisolithus tinctorius Marx 270 TaxID=870435 RepID=A0A0C3P3J0_PISTI|nr:hypothetical protein M404DRAFT_23471 [Pisolithus tinctorius Marx 270]
MEPEPKGVHFFLVEDSDNILFTSNLRASPLRIALLERSLAEPDRIVGPGGVAALQKLGLESCLEGIHAIPIVHIPYPDGRQGCSFHHGRFVMALRERAKRVPGVDVIEATVNELIECQHTKQILGVHGCFSNFRNTVMGKASRESTTGSQFCGVILKDIQLPMLQHGTVALARGRGPVLMYQISEHDTRMLVAVKHPIPHDLKGHVLKDVVLHLPASLHVAVHEALDKDRIRRMPSFFLPAVEQGGKITDENLAVLQRGCFKYFERGGECVRGPVSLLAGIAPSPTLLAYHFFAVAFYSIWVMFFHPRLAVNESNPDKPLMLSPHIWEYPGLAVKSVTVVSGIVLFASLR